VAQSTRRLLLALAITAIAGGVLLGGMHMAFLCDDAFITFRYVANAREGLGLVWNPPPFQPVEGYTGFAWAILLWFVWSVFGAEPPAAANWLSLLFGLAQFALVACALLRLRRADGSRWPETVVLLALLVVATNRTFLQWLTSGLETSLFNLATVAWVLLAFRSARARDTRWLAAWATAAALGALTRPDGLLFVAATALVGLLRVRRSGWGQVAVGLSPLAAVVLHVVWRRWFYGEWLPNTYYAKVSAAWPEAGTRYLVCFVVEHGTWVVGLLAIVWGVAELRRGWSAARDLAAQSLPAVAAVAALGMHVGYYTLVVGGDHFEYRIYSDLVPLMPVAAVAMAGRIGLRAGAVVSWLLAAWIAAGVGWLEAWQSRDVPNHGVRSISQCLPGPLQPLLRWYDRDQLWLRTRLICIRCVEHARFLEAAGPDAPRQDLATAEEPFPVVVLESVGCLGWRLPDTAIVDRLGLNDWVVARTPVARPDAESLRPHLRDLFVRMDADGNDTLDETEIGEAMRSMLGGRSANDVARALVVWQPGEPGGFGPREFEDLGLSLAFVRKMAHERQPPPGYVEGLRPNVEIVDDLAVARPRDVPLTAEEIVRHEDEWRGRTRAVLAERR
jgi:arabinofuranosyltransferase